jgi:putative nucleotidyltransferase with HDIG domain
VNVDSLPRPGEPRSAAVDDLDRQVERRIAAGRLDLPMLPQVASEVIAGGLDDSTDIQHLAGLLNRDQALAGHVLRVANSPIYAGGARIQTIQQALVRIGFSQLREIVVAVALRTRVFSGAGHQDLLGALWTHSVAAAAYAREVARALRTNVESAFLCGLLHDVGKPVVLSLALDLAKEAGLKLSRGRLEPILAIHHTHAGQRLAEHWVLPDATAQAVARHHDFESATQHAQTVQIACLADVLAHWALGTGEPAIDEEEVQAHPVCAALNLYPEDVLALMQRRDAVLSIMEALGS